jgi:hypothetical protein
VAVQHRRMADCRESWCCHDVCLHGRHDSVGGTTEPCATLALFCYFAVVSSRTISRYLMLLLLLLLLQ